MKNPALNLTVLNWNRLILLYGPPGSGKTTLAKALAQKLTIRLGKQFTRGKLVEVNSHSVLSKWFGESSKLVGKMFDSIHIMAEEETTLICVLIDEVETLTSSRERAASGNECGDAVRVSLANLEGCKIIRDPAWRGSVTVLDGHTQTSYQL